jgi:hypothetical protein
VPRPKNAWNYTSTSHYAFMAWCSFKKKHRDNRENSEVPDIDGRIIL